MILDQVARKWDADSALRAAAGPLFAGEVPEYNEDNSEVAFPYTYCLVGSTSFHYLMGVANYLEATEVTFNVFTSGMKKAQTAIRAVQDAFAWATDLTFDDATSSVFSIRPLSAGLDSQNARDKDGQPVYRGWVSLLFTTNRIES